MEPTELEIYALGDLAIAGGTVSLVPGYDGSNDGILTLIDDDNLFDGDSTNDEQGNDTNQFGTIVFPDGTTLGSPTTNVFSEVQALLTAPDGSTITIIQVEVANPTGAATIAGFLPSSPLESGVTYTFTATNTTPTTPAPPVDEIVGAVCFTSDNMIETDTGEVRASDLKIGMMIKTINGVSQPLKWIYRRCVTPEDMKKYPQLRPISFAPNSLGKSIPNKEMKLSPQHKLLITSPINQMYFEHSSLLVAAKHLVNNTTITIDKSDEGIEYIHLLLDRHEVIYADGTEAESFNPGAWALGIMEAEAKMELDLLFPELRSSDTLHNFSTYPTVKAHEAVLISKAVTWQSVECTMDKVTHLIPDMPQA